MDENTTALSPEEKKRTVRLIDGQDYDPWECRGRAPSAETAAFGLARLNRYGGHTTRPYSVAEHSIWMALYIVCGGTDNPLFQESAAWFAGGTDPNEALRGLCMSRIFEATSILVRESDPLVLEVRFDGKKQCTTLFEREEPWYWLARFVEPDSLHQEAQITVASQPEIQWNVTLMGFIRPNPRTT